jgi:NADH dehydrogenase
VRLPGRLLPPISSVLNLALHDVLLTKDEYHAMADGLADTDGPATAPTAISDWLVEAAPELGAQYANELQRHFGVTSAA